MSASDLNLSSAIEAGGDALYDDLFEFGLNGTDASNAAEKCLTAALPHIRRAVIEELIEKAEREAESLLMNGEPDWVSADEANRYTRATEGARWLRAKAEEVGA